MQGCRGLSQAQAALHPSMYYFSTCPIFKKEKGGRRGAKFQKQMFFDMILQISQGSGFQ